MLQHCPLLISADNERNMKTLNNVAVEYFQWGLQDISYQIWDGLFHEIQRSSKDYGGLMPVISCNMGNVLRQTGYYEEAYRVLMQGLKRCFGAGVTDAMPELILQLSIVSMKFGYTEKAQSLYTFGINILRWSRRESVEQTMEEAMEQDFLLYCR